MASNSESSESSLLQYISSTASPPPTPLIPRYTPPPHSSFRKEQTSKTAKQDKAVYNKTRQKPSYGDWTKQPNRSGVSRADRRVRGTPRSNFKGGCYPPNYTLPFVTDESLLKPLRYRADACWELAGMRQWRLCLVPLALQ